MSSQDESLMFDGEGEYVEHRRHKAILDARQTARNVIIDAKRQHSRGEITQAALQADARTAVEMYITEIEHMAQMANAKRLLREELIHHINIAPPDSLLQYFENDDHSVRGTPPRAKTPDQGEIRGLWGYLTSPDVFTATWSIDVDIKHEGPKTVTETASVRMPVEASMDAFRKCNQFLQDAGLDIEPKMPDYTGEEGPGL